MTISEKAPGPPARLAGDLVGRTAELAAVASTLRRARDGIFVLSLEGEPGIGKSRLLTATAELAAADGFVPLTVTVDEEIRGPFLTARGIVSSPALRDGAGPAAIEALDRARDTLTGRDSALDGLLPDERMLRALDQATLALSVTALERPIALLLDDVQWADTDSLRIIRYLVRTEPGIPILIVLAMRAEEATSVPELVNLLADVDRLGLLRRVPIARFRQTETAELIRLRLGGQVDPSSAATLHSQAEGVPFVVLELVRTYVDAGLLQRFDGVWKLDPKAGRLLPSAVRTLVQRRAARLDEAARVALSEAAVLGRSFRLADLCAVRTRLGDTSTTPTSLSDSFAPAVAAGLLQEVRDGSGADYRFGHESVRESSLGLLSAARLREIHQAIVDILTADGEPPPEALPSLARHALAAGDPERSARFSIGAATAALAANAPEEALRLADEALPIIGTRAERVALLRARDDALEMLLRPSDRLESLAELAALADASGDETLGIEVALRRAAALRSDGQHDRAARLASAARQRAADDGDRAQELAANLELGQDLLHSAIGEGYGPMVRGDELDAAQEAYDRAIVLAEELGDDARLAAALRERGVIGSSRVRQWFIGWLESGAHLPILQRVAHGEMLMSILPELPIVDLFMETDAILERALERYQAVGDRRGAMSTIIAQAYLRRAGEIHLGSDPAQVIEEIRTLSSELRSFSRETDRSGAEARLLYSVHVFARSKVIPDLAVSRGVEAYERSKLLGDHPLSFAAAGGAAMAHLDIGASDEAGRWLDLAADEAAECPTPLRARQLETWRGILAEVRGEGSEMRAHLERAVELATASGRPAGRCEALATLALAFARVGRDTTDDGMLDQAETAAAEVRRIVRDLPGHPPWGAQADAVSATVAEARGDTEHALAAARAALETRRVAMREDPHLEILVPAARVVLAHGSDDERVTVRDELRLLRDLIARRTIDEGCRVAWFRGPRGRELAELAGDDRGEGGAAATPPDLLRLVADGRTNDEIATILGIDEPAVERELTELYARLGVGSRSEATALALRGDGP